MNVRCIALLLLPLACGSVSAGGVYKWVDKDGNVHFGDQADAEAARGPASEVKVKEGQADPEAIERMKRQQRYLDARAEDRADAKVKAAEEQKRQQQLAADCAKLQQNLDYLNQHARLYREGENGAREYLSGKDRDQEIAQTKALLDEHCR